VGKLQKQWFIYLYIARSQVNYGDYSYVSKTYLGPCQGKSQKHYTVGKKQEFTLKTETTGELYLQLYGGQYGRRGTLRVFENMENTIEQVKMNCILTLCFWCNQIYSNDIVSIIDVLDSL